MFISGRKNITFLLTIPFYGKFFQKKLKISSLPLILLKNYVKITASREQPHHVLFMSVIKKMSMLSKRLSVCKGLLFMKC